MKKSKKIFISGVAGFLGSHLADKFIEDGFNVIGCDNLIDLEIINNLTPKTWKNKIY